MVLLSLDDRVHFPSNNHQMVQIHPIKLIDIYAWMSTWSRHACSHSIDNRGMLSASAKKYFVVRHTADASRTCDLPPRRCFDFSNDSISTTSPPSEIMAPVTASASHNWFAFRFPPEPINSKMTKIQITFRCSAWHYRRDEELVAFQEAIFWIFTGAWTIWPNR